MLKLSKNDVKQLHTTAGQFRYLTKETKNWWLILFAIYFFINAVNVPKGQTFIEHLKTFFSFSNILTIFIFCLILSFIYSLIKLIHIKNRLKLKKNKKK